MVYKHLCCKVSCTLSDIDSQNRFFFSSKICIEGLMLEQKPTKIKTNKIEKY